MRYTDMSVSNLLSFGPQKVVFPEFKRFNLFIGPNGSGKSNALTLLGDVKSLIELRPLSDRTPVQFGQHTHLLKLSMAEFNWSAGNNSIDPMTQSGTLKLGYETQKQGAAVTNHLEFRHFQLTGDLNELERSVQLIFKPLSEIEVHKLLLERVINTNRPLRNLAVINFGIRTIFGKQYQLAISGALWEYHSLCPGDERLRAGGKTPQNYEPERWPSGVYFVVSVLLRVLSAAKIILIDEPERHLEPIACRRFMRFLFWLCLRGTETDLMVDSESEIESQYSKAWNTYMDKDRQRFYHSFRMLPNNSEVEPIEFKSTVQQQLFVASHSATLIQEFLNLSGAAEVYQFKLEWQRNDYRAPTLNDSSVDQWWERKTEFTNVRRIDTNVNNILDELGCRGSDILQANGIVWVEGPSDVVYLKRWIEMYCDESGLAPLKQGLDFEFQMFGGALLDSLSFVHSQEMSPEEQRRKLVEMFSFSRNAFVVIDSDAVEREGVIVDQSTFSAAKVFIQEQFESLRQKEYKLGLWFEDGQTEVRTLENYLDSESLVEHGLQSEKSISKKRYAQAVVESWSNQKSLSEFPNNLAAQIENLSKVILSWNER